MARFSPSIVSVLATLMVATLSCVRPDSVEQYVGIEQREPNGIYRYSLDLSDSLATYDITFYSRIDAGRQRMAEIGDFPLMVTWTSPSGQRYRETVFFNVRDKAHGSSFYTSQYRKPYRTGLVPVESGVWDLTVHVNAGNEVPGFRGLGVICRKSLPHGTR